jgi:hypothetical protein
MFIECGPAHDKRVLELSMPEHKHRIGVFVSGGLDSALLYYLLMKLNHEAGNTHEVIPFSVLRKEGSQYFARPVINYVNSCFGLSKQGLNVVGDPTLDEDAQVASGVIEVLVEAACDIVYVGVIDALPIHTVGWTPIVATETDNFKTPFSKLNKSHITDLVYNLGQEKLFEISHSCIKPLERCGCCNGCNERKWGFDQLNKTDPGRF